MHYSVLLAESLNLLQIKADGIYVDGTFGRGGHAQAILAKLGDDGKLIVFDKDPEAISYAKQICNDSRVIIVHASFAQIKQYLVSNGITQVDGILLDLGVSSPQLDTAERGFSFRFDALLDMRMDNTQGILVKDWLASASEEELATVFWRYGEERFSRKIAKLIVAKRSETPIISTKQLADLIAKHSVYKEKGQHPATRVFQALRIHINNELADLEQVLVSGPQLLKAGGRMLVISFHSLEDRIVKTKFNQLSMPLQLPKWVMLTKQSCDYRVIAKKVRASGEELIENSRSRSAILRCLERLSVTSN